MNQREKCLHNDFRALGVQIKMLCIPGYRETSKFENSSTVGCETLTVFSMPRIRKNGQCLEVQVDKTFLEFLSEITIF